MKLLEIPMGKVTACANCNLHFTRNCDLELHIETAHADAKKFECTECGENYIEMATRKTYRHALYKTS